MDCKSPCIIRKLFIMKIGNLHKILESICSRSYEFLFNLKYHELYSSFTLFEKFYINWI